MDSASKPKGKRAGCLLTGFVAASVAGTFLTLGLMFAVCSSGVDASRAKREAVKQSNRVIECALAGDRPCVQSGSSWDEATLDRTMELSARIGKRLGARGKAEVITDNWTHSVGTGPSWRIRLQLRTQYQRASDVMETVSLEGEQDRLTVTGINFNAQELLAP